MIKDIPISARTLAVYFKELHGSHSTTLYTLCQDHIVDDLQVSEICEDEVWLAIKTIKANKAPGIDQLPPSIFELFDDNLPK